MRPLMMTLVPVFLACATSQTDTSGGAPLSQATPRLAQAAPRPVNRAELDYVPAGPASPAPASSPSAVRVASPEGVEKALTQAGTLSLTATGGRSPVANLSCRVSWGAGGEGARVEGLAVSRINPDLKPEYKADLPRTELETLVGVALDQKVMELPGQLEEATARDLFTYTFTFEMGGQKNSVESYGAVSGPAQTMREQLEKTCHLDELVRAARPRR